MGTVKRPVALIGYRRGRRQPGERRLRGHRIAELVDEAGGELLRRAQLRKVADDGVITMPFAVGVTVTVDVVLVTDSP